MKQYVHLFGALVLFFAAQAFTQTVSSDAFRYQIEGSFEQDDDAINQVPLRFHLKWNEVNNQIRGTYSDNYYAPLEVPVLGSVTGARTFNVALPGVSHGAQTIELVTLATGSGSGSVSVTFTPKNSVGSPIVSRNVVGLMSTDPTLEERVDLADPQISCVVGMGALTGYCGKYAGTFEEVFDPRIRCRLLGVDARLELTTTGDFLIHTPPLVGPRLRNPDISPERYVQYVGSLNAAGPVSPSVDISRIECGEILGTTFPRESCLRLSLTGSFSELAGVQNFRGTYRIQEGSDEDEACQFSLNMDKL